MPRRKTGIIMGPEGWRHVLSKKDATRIKKFFAKMGYTKDAAVLVDNPYQFAPARERDPCAVSDPRFYLNPKVPVVEEVEAAEVIPYYLVPVKNNRRDAMRWSRVTSVGDKVIVYGSFGDFGREF